MMTSLDRQQRWVRRFVLLLLLGITASSAGAGPLLTGWPEARFHLFATSAGERALAPATRSSSATRPVATPAWTPGDAAVPSTVGTISPPTVGRFAVRTGRDLVALFEAPAHLSRRQWAYVGAGVALVGASSLLDDRARKVVRRDADPEDLRFPKAIRPLGQEGGLILLGATWAGGHAFHKPGIVAASQDGLEAALLAAGVVTPLLKAVTGRSRPRQGDGSNSFHPFGGSESFPSGEVTEAFAIASAVSAHSHHRWLDGTVWTLAGLTAWERMRLDAHWTSDVVAGALIGTAVGRWVVHRHRPRAAAGETQVELYPTALAHSYGLGLRVAF